MSLWLSKKEQQYLTLLVEEDLYTDVDYYTNLMSMSEEEREKLLKKIKDMKV
jgi:hypothetical protein